MLYKKFHREQIAQKELAGKYLYSLPISYLCICAYNAINLMNSLTIIRVNSIVVWQKPYRFGITSWWVNALIILICKQTIPLRTSWNRTMTEEKKDGLIKAGCQTKKGAARRRLEFCVAFLQTSELKIPPSPKASHYQEMKLQLPPAIGGEQHFEDALKCDRVRQLP